MNPFPSTFTGQHKTRLPLYLHTDYEAANPWLMLLRRIGYQILSEFSRKYNTKEQTNSNNENKVDGVTHCV